MELVRNENGKNVVSARMLHSFLEVKTDFTDWCKRMFEYGFEENQDFNLLKIEEVRTEGKRQVRREVTDYALTINTAKEISMLQRTDKGKEARQYFIKCEEQLKSLALNSYQIQDPIKRAEKWIEEQKEKLLLENKVENLSTALDSLVEWTSIIKVCQFNKVKESAFKWQVLKKKSEELGYEVKKAQSSRFDYQNLYHVNVFRACYPQYRYDFLDKK